MAALRACSVCDADVGPDRPDRCLGTLPGIKGACCGHGGSSECYVALGNGVFVVGEWARVLLKGLGGNPPTPTAPDRRDEFVWCESREGG